MNDPMKKNYAVMDGNTAAAHVAYAFTEVAAIYPIKKVNYFFLGCGTEEQMGTKKMVDSLRKLGIEVDYYESQGTAHEWLTWRRCLKEFVPHLFKH